MYLRLLYVEGFLSLDYTLMIFEPHTVIIGRNNTGKSSLLKLLSFIGNIYRGVSTNVAMDWIGQIPYTHDGSQSIFIKAVFTGFSIDDIYLYISVLPSMEIKEKVYYADRELLSSGGGVVRLINGSEYTINPYRSAMVQLPDELLPEEIQKIRNYLAGIKIYDISPVSVRRYMASPLRREYVLDSDGRNLLNVLYSLSLRNKNAIKAFTKIITSVLPEIKEISFVSGPAKLDINVTEKGYNTPFNIHELSDGVIAAMCYGCIILSAGMVPEMLTFIGIDEPEKYFHYTSLQTFIENLLALDTQVLLVTHSPEVVNMMDVSWIRIAKRLYGKTRFFKLREDYKKELEQEGILPGKILEEIETTEAVPLEEK